MNTYKIVQLTSENVKRINVVSIKPDGNLVVIGGNNGEGKTSLLDSIWYALGGNRPIPDDPVRHGESEATITLDLGEIVVKKVIKANRSTNLTVTTAKGQIVKSPQSLLDGLCGKLTFDPLAFTRMAPREQADMLMRLVGLDLSELNIKRVEAFDNRTAANREVKRLKAEIESRPQQPDAPDHVVSVAEMMTELEAAKTINNANEYIRDGLDSLLTEQEHLQERLSSIDGQIDMAKEEVKGLKPDADIDEIKAMLSKVDDQNRLARINEERASLRVQLKGQENKAESLTEAIDDIDKQKQDKLAEIKFPVEGLGFSEEGAVMLAGVPFDQGSGAEQLRASVAIGSASNPTLRIMRVTDGSLLDEKSLELLADLCDEHDMQVWLERVGRGNEVSVVIEDGMIENKEG